MFAAKGGHTSLECVLEDGQGILAAVPEKLVHDVDLEMQNLVQDGLLGICVRFYPIKQVLVNFVGLVDLALIDQGFCEMGLNQQHIGIARCKPSVCKAKHVIVKCFCIPPVLNIYCVDSLPFNSAQPINPRQVHVKVYMLLRIVHNSHWGRQRLPTRQERRARRLFIVKCEDKLVTKYVKFDEGESQRRQDAPWPKLQVAFVFGHQFSQLKYGPLGQYTHHEKYTSGEN